MTPAQEKVLNAVERHFASHSYAPSYAEIASICGLNSLATVHKHVERLVFEGFLYRPRGLNRARSLTLKPLAKLVIVNQLRDMQCPGCRAMVMADTRHECNGVIQ